LLLSASCSSEEGPPPSESDVGASPSDAVGDGPGDDVSAADGVDSPDGPADTGSEGLSPSGDICEFLELPVRPFDSSGPYGARRFELADDFTMPLYDGSMWTLSDHWSGCESYVFIPDTISFSEADGTSIWSDGVAQLVEMSPLNVHYFFVSRRANASVAAEAAAAMQERVDTFVAGASTGEAEHWRARLHVVDGSADTVGNWVGSSMSGGLGQAGMAIDRSQRVRGVGSLADVTRYDASLEWPWLRNIAYAANEARYHNYLARLEAEIAALESTEVDFWEGEVIEQFEDIEVELPSAAGFDTLHLEYTQRCPNPNAGEAGNCGAWDYLAHLWLYVGEGEEERRVEISRHITTYHREGHWLIDITPALALLEEGGARRFRWEWAPEWNVQPTATWLSLHYSNQDRGSRPIALTELWTGRAFNAAYNDDRAPIDVPIPAEATKVELWAIITGHGMEANNCAEFCNHQHEFIVGGRSYYREHADTIGNDRACMEAIDQGVVPNQWGTWWFGRGGWCPGQQVEPFVVDVTEHATPGSDMGVDYFGWYGGRTPPDGSGNIQLASWIVSYGP